MRDAISEIKRLASSMVSYYFVDTPQVHVHCDKTDAESDADGFDCVVVACHGCGQSINILFKLPEDPQPGGMPTLTRVREDFRLKHLGCPNYDFDSRCLPLLKGMQTEVDLRGQNLKQG